MRERELIKIGSWKTIPRQHYVDHPALINKEEQYHPVMEPLCWELFMIVYM